MSAIPNIGKNITVVCKNHNFGFVSWLPETSEYIGTVVEGFSWTNHDEFCMTTGLVNFPIRTLKIGNVLRIIDSSGKRTNILPDSIEPKKKEWTVEGSKGNIYVVSCNGNVWSCTCIAGSFGRDCKHVAEVKSENS